MHRVTPRCLAFVTSSATSLFRLIFALTVFALLVMILLFSFYPDFHSTCPCSVYESIGGVLKLAVAAAHTIDVVGES